MKRGREEGGGRPPSKKQNKSGGAGGSSKGEGGALTTHDALGYLREVKTRFQDQKAVYDQFLEIMKDFKASRIDTPGVVARVKTLFKGDRELILGFNTFLPKGYEITMEDLKEKKPEKAEKAEKQPVEFDQAISYVNKIKKRFSTDERVYRAFLEILNLYRRAQKTITQVYDEVSLLFRGHNDLLEEFTYFLPETRAVVANQPKNKGKSRNRSRSNEVTSIPGKKRLVSRSVVDEAKAGVKREKEGGAKREGAVKEHVPAALEFESTQQYLELVRTRLKNRDAYQDFLKLLHLFGQDIITMGEMKELVLDILSRYPDLLAGFDEFLKHGVAEMDGIDIPAGKITVRDAQKARQQAASQLSKFMTRSIAELDLSNCEKCTPSYRLLPRNYPHLKVTHRNAIGREVFNDKWVGVTSGSEDYSFKHMRKNQYEENLFRAEDDKYELDMLLECNKAAIRRMKPVATRILEMRPDEKAVYRMAPDVLKPIHMRVIEKIYGEQGPSLVQLLRSNPSVAVPVVLTRLEQKAEEWQKVKENMQVHWQKTFDQNFHKSLDHRSFYFKQTDKKQLGSKNMINELKDVAEKRRGGLSAVSVADDMRERLNLDVTPDMLLDLSDMDVHEDVYRVVLAAVEEMLNNTVARKVMEVWGGFVEAFVGLPRRKLPTFETDDEDAAGGGAGMGGDSADAKAAKQRNRKRTMEEDDDEEEEDRKSKKSGSADDGEGDSDRGKSSSGKRGRGRGGGEGVEDDESRFDRCRPLSAGMAGGQPGSTTLEEARGQAGGVTGLAGEAGSSSAGTAVRGGSVFYGNDTVYIMLRLYYFLYDRLRVARKCAAENKPCQRGKGDIAQAPSGAEETHERFMQMVMDVIDGTLEPGQYEDDCRALMGTNSYVLYTLDKLIYKLIKQLQSLLADDLGCKLISLWHYEARRTRMLPAAKEALHYINSHVLMHDDLCFRFVMEPREHRVRVNLLEPNKIEVAAGLVEANFSSYMYTYIASLAGEDESGVFLRRTLPKELRNVAVMAGDETIEEALEAALKVSYVLETEDSFVSERLLKRPWKDRVDALKAANKKRGDTFHAWMDRCLEEIKLEEGDGEAAKAAAKATVWAAEEAAAPIENGEENEDAAMGKERQNEDAAKVNAEHADEYEEDSDTSGEDSDDEEDSSGEDFDDQKGEDAMVECDEEAKEEAAKAAAKATVRAAQEAAAPMENGEENEDAAMGKERQNEDAAKVNAKLADEYEEDSDSSDDYSDSSDEDFDDQKGKDAKVEGDGEAAKAAAKATVRAAEESAAPMGDGEENEDAAMGKERQNEDAAKVNAKHADKYEEDSDSSDDYSDSSDEDFDDQKGKDAKVEGDGEAAKAAAKAIVRAAEDAAAPMEDGEENEDAAMGKERQNEDAAKVNAKHADKYEEDSDSSDDYSDSSDEDFDDQKGKDAKVEGDGEAAKAAAKAIVRAAEDAAAPMEDGEENEDAAMGKERQNEDAAKVNAEHADEYEEDSDSSGDYSDSSDEDFDDQKGEDAKVEGDDEEVGAIQHNSLMDAAAATGDALAGAGSSKEQND